MKPILFLAAILSLFAPAPAHAAPTETQIQDLLRLLGDRNPDTRQTALELARGSEYLFDARVQRAVIDLFDDDYERVNTLAEAIATEIPGTPLPTLLYVFEKSELAHGDGGWSSNGQDRGVKFFQDRAGNDAVLFHELLAKLLKLLDTKYPDFPASNFNHFALCFHGLGTQASLIAELPLIRAVYAKMPESDLHLFLMYLTGSYEPFSQPDQDELLRLFLSSDNPKDETDAGMARWLLTEAKALSLPTLGKLKEEVLHGTPFHQDRARDFLHNSLHFRDASEAPLLDDLAREAGGNPELTEWVYSQIWTFELLPNFPDAHDVFERALASVFAGGQNDFALRLVAKYDSMLSRAEIARLLGMLDDERILRLFIQARPLQFDAAAWRLFFGVLNNASLNVRTGGERLLGNYLNFAHPDDFISDEAIIPEITSLLDQCRSSTYSDVSQFCTSEVSSLADFLQKNLTSLPLRWVFGWMSNDVKRALQDPLLDGRSLTYPSYRTLSNIKIDAQMKWTAADFRATWLPFFAEQFRTGNATVINNTWKYLGLFHLAGAPANPFWHLEKGDGVVEALLPRFLGNDESAARMSGQILMILALVDKSPAGLELAQRMIALLDDPRPLVVSGVIDGLAVFDSVDAATLAKIEKLAKSDQPEVRGTALGTLALFFATKKIGRDVYVPLLPDVQRSLLSDSLAERSTADYSGWVPTEFADVRATLFPADFVTRLLAAFTAQHDRFMRDDEEASRYFRSFESAMLPISRGASKVVPFEAFPLELFLDTAGSANLQVAAQSVRSLYFQQASSCDSKPNKRYGLLHLGTRLVDVKVSKRVLDRFAAAITGKNGDLLAWQADAIINYPGPDVFSIRDYAAGKLSISWE